MDEGMDTGPVLMSASTSIGPDETAGELAARLSVLGAELLVETLARLDELTPDPQRHDQATLAPRLRKSDGHLDWPRPAAELANLVRGCNPWPGALTLTPKGRLTIWRARVVEAPPGPPGALVTHGAELAVATGDGVLLPEEVQPESRRALSWREFLRGARLRAGERLSGP